MLGLASVAKLKHFWYSSESMTSKWQCATLIVGSFVLTEKQCCCQFSDSAAKAVVLIFTSSIIKHVCQSVFPNRFVQDSNPFVKYIIHWLCVSAEGKQSGELFVFDQISWFQRLGSLAGVFFFFWVFLYIMYIIVHTVCDMICTGSPHTLYQEQIYLLWIKMQKTAKSHFCAYL